MRRATVLLGLTLTVVGLPSGAAAQQDPMERLAEVLPESVRERVLAQIEAARARELPEQAMANLALEGVAKARGSEEVLAAVELLVADMGRAQEAIQAAGREPGAGEIEAATAAMRKGVDGASVSELARTGPSGRSLVVPLFVIGELTDRGLPSDDALTAVRDRLEARADDAELLRTFPEISGGIGLANRPELRGTDLASTRAGFQVPASGGTVPVGPQQDRGRPEGTGRGGGPGN
jgi:hypothetical protein